MEFRDPLGVNTTLDFVVRVCASLAPARVAADRLAILGSGAGSLPIAPVFIALSPDGAHAPAPTRLVTGGVW